MALSSDSRIPGPGVGAIGVEDPIATTERSRSKRRGVIVRSVLELAGELRQGRITHERVTMGQAFDRLGQEGLGLALLVLTLPALIPIPGPVGFTFGTLTFFIGLQVLLGAQSLWLPGILRRQTLPTSAMRRVIAASLPWLMRIERHLQESRLPRLAGPEARVLLAAPVMGLAFIIALPIPFGNMAPAIALVAFAVGFLARDGLAILAAIVLAALAFGWTVVLIATGASILDWLGGLVGW